MTTLARLISERIEASGSDTILRFLDRGETERVAITHADLDRNARGLAALLVERKPSGPVLLVFDPGHEFIEALLACLYAGLIAIPAPAPRAGASLERLEGIVVASGATLMLTSHALATDIAARARAGGALAGVDVVAADATESRAPMFACPGFDLDDRAPVLVQYTSGSTLAPRGVVLNSAGAIANLQYTGRGTGVGTGGAETFVNWMPHYHDMGLVGGILIPLAMGFDSVHLAPLDFVQKPVRWLQAIDRYRGTFAGGPPLAFDMCVGRIADDLVETLDLSSWRIAFCGAEPVFETTLAAFRRRFAAAGLDPRSVFSVYGMAEMTVYACGSPAPADAPPAAADPLERAPCHLDGEASAAIRIVSRDGAVVPDGIEGEIWISHPSVAAGYLNDPAATSAVFARSLREPDGQAYLATGDLGVLQGQVLRITGRTKDVLIRDGVNIAAADIERLATEGRPQLNPNGAAAFEGDGPRAPIVLILEKSRGQWDEAAEDGLVRAVRRSVFDHLGVRIDAIRFVEPGMLPRTTSGKIQRASARAAWLREAGAAAG